MHSDHLHTPCMRVCKARIASVRRPQRVLLGFLVWRLLCFLLDGALTASAVACRIPRTSLKAFVQQPDAFAEVIASLAGDSPPQPQLQRQASKPRPRPSAPQVRLLHDTPPCRKHSSYSLQRCQG